VTLGTDERRALAIIAALLLLASGARWLERPQPLLDDAPSVDVAALESASREGKAPQERTPAGPIDPNTATAAELDRLPGVGPSLAARIVEERERAPFRTVGDLTRVRGIGPSLATTLAGKVTLPAGPAVTRSTAVEGLTPVKSAAGAVSGQAHGAPADINYIGSTDLQKVRGVGPALAAKLIARRDSLGGFSSWAQVDSVAGVGPALLGRLREALVLGR
jgi:competence ComEA-like helix-hairpin-helix protein